MNEQTSLYEIIENIVQVVFYTHYNYIKDPDLKEDLFQIGYLKAYELLNNGNYDPSFSFRNFIYTGVRNEMHNTLYHLNKLQTVDLEILDKYDNIVGFHDTGEYDVDQLFIKEICNRYKRFGDYYPLVYNYLLNLHIIKGKPLKENPKYRDSLFEGIMSLVIWELFEKERDNG